MDTPTEAVAWAPEHAAGDIVALAAAEPRIKLAGTTRVVLDNELNPFDRLTADGRKRLLVRVLCGLVAYDTDHDATGLLAG